jgi:hypothetical protein
MLGGVRKMEINMSEETNESSITIQILGLGEDGAPENVNMYIDGELSIFNSLIALHSAVHMVSANLIRVAVESKFPDYEINAREEVIAQLAMPIMSLVGFNLSSLRQSINSIVHEITSSDFERVAALGVELAKVKIEEGTVDDEQSE